MISHSRKFGSGCRGFLMIEVMVTMVILAVGLLGAAALQARSMQYSYASAQRTIATIQANDLVERMWASACELPDKLDTVQSDWQEDWERESVWLPNWQGLVETVDEHTPIYKITINWSDSRISDASAGQQEFLYHASVPRLSCNT